MVKKPRLRIPKYQPRRRWPGVVLTTAVLLFAYGSVLIGLGGLRAGESEVAGAALGTGIVLTPVTFAVAAFISARPRPIRGTFLAWAAWLAALPLTYIDVMVGLIAGYAAAVAIAMALPDGVRWTHRAVAIGVLVVLAAIGARLAPAAVVLTIPLVIAPAMAFADDAARGFPLPERQSRTRTRRSS